MRNLSMICLKLTGYERLCMISRLHKASVQSRNSACNFEIGVHFCNLKNVQRNFEIARIDKLCGTHIVRSIHISLHQAWLLARQWKKAQTLHAQETERCRGLLYPTLPMSGVPMAVWKAGELRECAFRRLHTCSTCALHFWEEMVLEEG